MIVVGVTGSIASGKSTAAGVFAAAGIPVFDADQVVHELYRDPPAALTRAFPEAIADGVVDRGRLAAMIEADPTTLERLEAVTHPIVLDHALAFLAEARAADRPLAVLDVPLLFESGLDALCDRTLVTTVPAELRAERVADRGTMSDALYRALVARQLPDAAKLARADYVVDSTAAKDEVARVIGDIIAGLSAEAAKD